jgi:DNA-binding NarL/FixJ family response regulator
LAAARPGAGDLGREVLTRLAEAGDAVYAHADIALVLLDLHMPGREGFAALETLASERPALRSSFYPARKVADMQRAFDSGAMGFIPKAATPAVIVNVLRLLLAGGVYVPPALVQQGGASPAPPPSDIPLTPR